MWPIATSSRERTCHDADNRPPRNGHRFQEVPVPRLRQIPRAEAAPSVIRMYDFLFGDRDPVAEPGTATGTPGDWWTVFALVPKVFDHAVAGFRLYQTS